MKEFKGLYVHTPFCRSKCPYCDFYSEELKGERDSYLKLLLTEASLIEPHFSQFPTVYFGGGTPSLMEESFFEGVLSKVGQFSEVTVEFNPEDATVEKLKNLKEIGVNRISLGIQSLSDETLKRLGRRQRRKENLQALENTLKVFSNVSVDLIFGAPGQKPEELLREVEELLSYPIKHLSLYNLTVYRETPLGRLVEEGRVELPPEEEVEEAYLSACQLLTERGFNHYEISNFALPGFESKHNLLYWKVENYLGIGPSAASLLERRYWRNWASLKRYAELLKAGERPAEEVVELSQEELFELKLNMGLRLSEGVELPPKTAEKLRESGRISSLIEEGLVELEGNRIRLTKRGFLLENPLIAEIVRVLNRGG